MEAVDKKKARLNCINHLLTQVPYQDIHRDPLVLPEREHSPDYARNEVPARMYVPELF